MFSLLPLPVTPIRPASALLPAPDATPKVEPLAAPGPVTQTELADPALAPSGAEPVVLSSLLRTRAGEQTDPSPTYGTAPDWIGTDVQLRATAARALTERSALTELDQTTAQQTAVALRDLIPRDPAPEPRMMLTL